MKEIRQDIEMPIDLPRRGRRDINPFGAMDVGASFFVENERLAAVRVAVSRRNKKGGDKFLVGRHIDKRGVEQWRCWRIA